MDRDELEELHCIQPLANLESICELGILSHNEAAKIRHVDISMGVIQDRRAGREVPDARRAKNRELHDYANLYICARNPMLYVRRSRHAELCVLKIDVSVLDLDGVVITDGNAASDYSLFQAAPYGLAIVDEEKTFARRWDHPGYYAYLDAKRRKCAEVLVPDRVPADFIVGAYVSCDSARGACIDIDLPGSVVIDPDLFFR